MQSHPEHNDDPQADRGKGGLWIAVAIATVVMIIVVLHLTGVIGPGAH